MVFSSHLFLFYFLPLALLLYYAVPVRARNVLLTLLSYVFYGWANPLFVLLMLLSTLLDFACGLLLVAGLPRDPDGGLPLLSSSVRTMRQKAALACSLAGNLGLLAFFKYWNFGAEVLQEAAGRLGWSLPEPGAVLQVVLPLGISFYTFQSMSYCIDVYRGEARAIRSLWDFACFVSMFPQLVAGPILRFHDVSLQLQQRVHSLERMTRGICCFSLGLAKKVLIADGLSQLVDFVFAANAPSMSAAWLGTVAWAFQIYFDFSGYSDMAMGLGWMLGFDFCANFDSPYRAVGLADFWRRWHMSLSGWLRDYLYIPLGGNRRGGLRTSWNLLLVMLLGGLWHGAAWTYVVWGGVHGVLLLLERLLCGGRSPQQRMALVPQGLRRLLLTATTFGVICLTWVPFRADSLGQAGLLWSAMLGGGRQDGSTVIVDAVVRQPWHLWMLALGAGIVWLAPQQSRQFVSVLTGRRVLVCMVLLWLSILQLTLQQQQPFIYFMF